MGRLYCCFGLWKKVCGNVGIMWRMDYLILILAISLPLWLLFVFWYQRKRLNRRRKYKAMGADWPVEWMGSKGIEEMSWEDTTAQPASAERAEDSRTRDL
ncbi:hypothetical protein Cocul_02231 [Corynebacterium oculi]|uniref:Uncharacterized protein n=2 Tax=Corynebacterium oculi TaxID=1544416 RepID=A0A0Q0TWJ6_9CORY|nr:hypothetical protein Cocul_02231 [Corynebacterium oculi]